MTYILTKNGSQIDKYPYSFDQLKLDNPDISYPREVDDLWLAVQGIEKVQVLEQPHDTRDHYYIAAEPRIVEGQWIQEWTEVARPAPTKEELIAYAKYVRYKKEIAGIDLGNGVYVATDRESQVKITGARVAADSKEDWFTVWDAADGNTHMITAPAMIMISDAVESYVNGCFVVYAGIKSDIDNGLIATYQTIDEVFDNAIP